MQCETAFRFGDIAIPLKVQCECDVVADRVVGGGVSRAARAGVLAEADVPPPVVGIPMVRCPRFRLSGCFGVPLSFGTEVIATGPHWLPVPAGARFPLLTFDPGEGGRGGRGGGALLPDAGALVDREPPGSGPRRGRTRGGGQRPEDGCPQHPRRTGAAEEATVHGGARGVAPKSGPDGSVRPPDQGGKGPQGAGRGDHAEADRHDQLPHAGSPEMDAGAADPVPGTARFVQGGRPPGADTRARRLWMSYGNP